MKREHWKSRIGFMWAAIGSAVGLGSIWRFPYIVGQNGGAVFVFLFVIFLLAISLPVLMAEIVIGRKSQKSPYDAFLQLGRNRVWGLMGFVTIVTGFLVSSFYSVICGWTLGYLLEALGGGLTQVATVAQSKNNFIALVGSPQWALATHFGFMFLSTLVLYLGVQKGIEAGNKIFMPLLFFILVILVAKALTMPGAERGLKFLFTPDWSSITPSVVVMALGQAFFGLSIGQGTMVTYGSYLPQKENIPNTCLPISLAVVVVSLLAGVAIFTVLFSVGMEPTAGTTLMFQTLPLVFSQISGGYFLSILFFLLIILAGLTSLISAMEPMISFLLDNKKIGRHFAVVLTGSISFLVGIPSALSFGVWKEFKIFGLSYFDAISFFSINILIPLGALASVILLGWRWGLPDAMKNLTLGTGKIYKQYPILENYLRFGIKYLAPLVIIVILLNLLGVL